MSIFYVFMARAIYRLRYNDKMFRLELIEEGWKLKEDSSAPRYSTMESLKDAREV